MPKLTDDEVGQLLRETFADKENLVDQLPEATTSPVRRKLPVLVAAAAVLAVLGGGVSIVGTDHKQEARPTPNQTVPVSGSHAASKPTTGVTTLELNVTQYSWGLAIKELTKAERPAGGWPVVKVLDAPYQAAGNPTGPGKAGAPFNENDRARIEGYAGVPIEWVKSRPTGPDICDRPVGTPYVTLGRVVMDKKGSSGTVGVSMWRGCLDGRWLTYRLADVPNPKGGSDWKITGTVGPVAIS